MPLAGQGLYRRAAVLATGGSSWYLARWPMPRRGKLGRNLEAKKTLRWTRCEYVNMEMWRLAEDGDGWFWSTGSGKC